MRTKWEPFDVNGAVFRPKGILLYIEEPDFGCEGVPENKPVYGTVVIEDKTGQRKVEIEQKLLFSSHLDDGMWYGKLADQLVLIGRDKKTVYQPRPEERLWLEALSK